MYQLLRHPGIHPVTMSIKLMFYVPADVPGDDDEVLSSKLDGMLSANGKAGNGRSPSRAQIGASNRLRPPSAAVPRRSKSRGQSRSQSRSQSRAFATQDGHLMASHARRSTTFGGRKSTTSFGQGLEPHAESPEVSGRLAGIQKAIANSSYIHYEFVPPHDERTSKNDMVIHHNSGKVFVDGEMRVASWEKLSDDVLCGSWTHSYDIAVGSDIISDFYHKGLAITLFDSRDRVSTRARFDRPKPGGPVSKVSDFSVEDHPEIPPTREPLKNVPSE